MIDRIDNTRARQNTNKENALALAMAGVPVFPASGDTKTPLIKAFNKLDSAIPEDEREQYRAQYREENDTTENPVHIGATTNKATIHKIWRKFPNAVPAIACGPAGLVVLDADVKNNGPGLLGAKFAEHGGLPEGAIVVETQSGGQHIYFSDSAGEFTNRAGALKRDCGTDVRGKGGQTIAPGSWLENGKRYGDRADLVKFIKAWRGKKLPELPAFARDMIGQSAGLDGETPLSDSDPVVKSLIEQLGANDWPEFSVTFDPVLGKYDLESLREREPEFAILCDEPSNDRSANRFNAARCLVGAFPHLTVLDYVSFLTDWDGAGEFDERAAAREFAKAKASPQYVPTDGSAFADVSDQVENDTSPKESETKKPERFVFLEDIRNAEPRFIEWVVKFFLARGTTSMVSGQWGAGKTAVFADVALHVAHGLAYYGRKVTKGVVIYVALENPDDVERRVQTWCEAMASAGHEVTGGAFALHRGPCGLFDQDAKPTRDERELIAFAHRASRRYGLPVALVVVDTLSQAIQPGDENKDGAKFVSAMQRIAQATGANVVALHHPTKAGQEVRGDGALQGNVDTVIVVTRDASGRGKIRAGSKFRIGDPSKVHFDYRLKSHVVGHDEDGDEVRVVLAEPETTRPEMAVDESAEDEEAMTAKDEPADKLQQTLRAVEYCIHEIAATTGDKPPEIGVAAGQVFARLNLDRKGAGLPVLKDRTMATRLLGKLVEAGEIVKLGDNRRTEYRLAASISVRSKL